MYTQWRALFLFLKFETGDPTTFGSLDDHAHHVLHLLAVGALRPAAGRLLQAPAVRTRAGCHRVADQQLPAALGKELRRSTQTNTDQAAGHSSGAVHRQTQCAKASKG